MRASSELQLAFVLEADLAKIVLAAEVSPSDEFARVSFRRFDDGSALVRIEGRTRAAVFRVARRLLVPAVPAGRGRTMDAVLKTPGMQPSDVRDILNGSPGKIIPMSGPSGRMLPGTTDGIAIVLGAEVAFSFTRMPVDTGGEQESLNHETLAPSPDLAPR